MIMNKDVEVLIGNEIYNFIDFYTSDDKEREQMKIVADRYIENDLDVEPSRLNELEEKAWLNITGEEIIETLRTHNTNEEADEYEKLAYGDEDE
jgi:hypothetical protein